VNEIEKESFENELFGGINVKPDILIRTSNEIRMSNFLLYQTDDC
jgi:undecaprenyl diphosphate synthase